MNAEDIIKDEYPFIKEVAIFVPCKNDIDATCWCDIDESLEVYYKLEHTGYNYKEIVPFVKSTIRMVYGRGSTVSLRQINNK